MSKAPVENSVLVNYILPNTIEKPKTPPNCIIYNCNNTSVLHAKHGVSFHTLPSDPVMKQKWIDLIRQDRNNEKWKPTKFTTVCSKHFEEKDFYYTEIGLRKVVDRAIPKKNLSCCNRTCINNPNSTSKPAFQVIITKCSELTDTNDISTTKSKKSQNANDTSESSSEEDSMSDSDIESVNVNRDIVNLERQLRKHKNSKLANRKKIKALNQRVRRLNRTNKSLKSMLKDIKDKYMIDPKIDTKPTLSEVSVEIFRNMYVKRKKKVQYSTAVKKFCLTLNSYSPKAYEYVRDNLNFSLPHPKTLPKWNDVEPDIVNTCGNKEKQNLPDDFSSEDDYTTEIPEQYLANPQYPVQPPQYPAIQHNNYPSTQQNCPQETQNLENGYSSKEYEYPSQLPGP